MMRILYLLVLPLLFSCSISKKIAKQSQKILLQDSAITHAHIGISIYDATANKYLYNHDAQKYFVPASNTKIPTCYAAMKYLGDSIVGLKYKRQGDYYTLYGTGDPSFLHSDYNRQPVFDFFKSIGTRYRIDLYNFRDEPLGNGWAWNDYNEDYMPERSSFPIYGNVMTISVQNETISSFPGYFLNPKYKDPNLVYAKEAIELSDKNDIVRQKFNNGFSKISSNNKPFSKTIPFITSTDLAANLLYDTLYQYYKSNKQGILLGKENELTKIYSQPTDSILKPMMHRSDNFFAEQSLLMVSNEKLGYMNDAEVINYIKKNDFAGIPQMPRWVDGSGLSRYNMFTPQSLVWILNKMKNEFGMTRIQTIFATGGEGTLSNLFKKESGAIFAKTGTLSNHSALSGFLYTKKGKLLIFSILTNGYQGSATPVRKAVEKFLNQLRERY